MSLALNAPPDPYQRINSLQHALREKVERIEQLEDELRQERIKTRAVEQGAEQLRQILHPLYNAIQLIYGHVDEMGINGSAPGPVDSGKQKVWESWKQKLGGSTGRAIDILLLHGPMNQTQLRIQLSCATRTITNIVGALSRAGLINKVDGKIALKEL